MERKAQYISLRCVRDTFRLFDLFSSIVRKWNSLLSSFDVIFWFDRRKWTEIDGRAWVSNVKCARTECELTAVRNRSPIFNWDSNRNSFDMWSYEQKKRKHRIPAPLDILKKIEENKKQKTNYQENNRTQALETRFGLINFLATKRLMIDILNQILF